MGVEYDGTAYCGFQSQVDLPTVQGQLEVALSKVANHPVKLVCAGRTDTGVHATEQVIHFDTDAIRSLRAWTLGANRFVARDISIKWALEVPDSFHARFSAIKRRYYYLIYNNWTRSALMQHKAAWHCRPLDVTRMQNAAQALLGHHDFSSFRASECQAKHPNRTLYDLKVIRKNDFVIITAQADGFLHHMVRNMSGVLMTIGEGAQPISWAQTVLEARDRTLGGVTAPSEGLYLHKITYPTHFHLPESVKVFDEMI